MAKNQITNLSAITLMLILISPASVTSRLAQLGCLSYGEKTNIQNVKSDTLALVKSTQPEWCEDPDSRSAGLRNRTSETSKSPYIIHSWNHTASNAFRVKIRTRMKNDKINYIQELIIQARPIIAGINPMQINWTKSVGRFYISPPDIQQGCCDLFDRNIARIYRPINQTVSISLLWQSNGFYEDYEGPFVFVATVSNTLSRYWTRVKSHVQFTTPNPMVEPVNISTTQTDANTNNYTATTTSNPSNLAVSTTTITNNFTATPTNLTESNLSAANPTASNLTATNLIASNITETTNTNNYTIVTPSSNNLTDVATTNNLTAAAATTHPSNFTDTMNTNNLTETTGSNNNSNTTATPNNLAGVSTSSNLSATNNNLVNLTEATNMTYFTDVTTTNNLAALTNSSQNNLTEATTISYSNLTETAPTTTPHTQLNLTVATPQLTSTVASTQPSSFLNLSSMHNSTTNSTLNAEPNFTVTSSTGPSTTLVQINFTTTTPQHFVGSQPSPFLNLTTLHNSSTTFQIQPNTTEIPNTTNTPQLPPFLNLSTIHNSTSDIPTFQLNQSTTISNLAYTQPLPMPILNLSE